MVCKTKLHNLWKKYKSNKYLNEYITVNKIKKKKYEEKKKNKSLNIQRTKRTKTKMKIQFIQIENTNIRMWSLKKYILLNFKFKIQERLSKNNYVKKII